MNKTTTLKRRRLQLRKQLLEEELDNNNRLQIRKVQVLTRDNSRANPPITRTHSRQARRRLTRKEELSHRLRSPVRAERRAAKWRGRLSPPWQTAKSRNLKIEILTNSLRELCRMRSSKLKR